MVGQRDVWTKVQIDRCADEQTVGNTVRVDFKLFPSFWGKREGGGGYPLVTLECPENRGMFFN